MAKKDLLGGALWDQYSNNVSRRMNNPVNLGVITEEEAAAAGGKLIVADYGAESCGDSVRLYWIIDNNNIVTHAKFKSFGCGTAIASSDVMCELCIGKTVDETLNITNIDVERALRDEANTPAVPPQKMHCSVMAYDVIKKAVALFHGVDMASLEKENILCECARVTVSDVEDAIKINDLKTVEEVVNFTKAGAFCKSCIEPGGHEKKDVYIVDILKRVRAEMDAGKLDEENFEEISIIHQIKAIETVFDAEIRPALAQDGGGLLLEDIKPSADEILIFIKYQGACQGCAGAMTGTLSFIQSKLQEKLSPKIRVQAV